MALQFFHHIFPVLIELRMVFHRQQAWASRVAAPTVPEKALGIEYYIDDRHGGTLTVNAQYASAHLIAISESSAADRGRWRTIGCCRSRGSGQRRDASTQGNAFDGHRVVLRDDVLGNHSGTLQLIGLDIYCIDDVRLYKGRTLRWGRPPGRRKSRAGLPGGLWTYFHLHGYAFYYPVKMDC